MTETFSSDRIGIVINPNAKRVRKMLKKRKYFWEEFFEESKVEITPDIPAIPAALERLKAQDIQVLAVYGGDGTLQRTITAAAGVWGAENIPPVLVLKGGTANALVKNMGIRKKARNYLRYFYKTLTQEKYHKVEIFEVPMLKVVEEDTGIVNYGFIFANGLVYKSIVQFHEVESPGAWQTFKVGIYPVIAYYLGLKSGKNYFQSPTMTVNIDGKTEFTAPVNVALLSTLKKLILWYAPFTGSIVGTDGFYGLINYMDLDELFDHFLGLARGKYQSEQNINQVMRDVLIKTDLGYMLDGELFEKKAPYTLRITRGISLKTVILPVI